MRQIVKYFLWKFGFGDVEFLLLTRDSSRSLASCIIFGFIKNIKHACEHEHQSLNFTIGCRCSTGLYESADIFRDEINSYRGDAVKALSVKLG